MKKSVLLTAGLAVIIAAGAFFYAGNGSRDDANSGTALDATALKQLVQDYSSRTLTAESASISSTQLVVQETDGKSATYSLPEDEFFVSIAPYVTKTHPCATHSLTGCQGEMPAQDFSVSVQDAAGNQVMDKQTVQSQPNGFIDLWLPRDKTYNVTIEQDGKQAVSEISTFEQNDTCVTTMQLG
ncbi:CueP family metal-binding protein [Paenibacillus camerounensis]|uniref:CueP family metal-binding protein n=1 Tax=Paenibacillus camerounensis TaxID=1243663 RepID=UPI0005A7596B|nr:CueP family metal-binding protein [Paenibacillus camerounensis]